MRRQQLLLALAAAVFAMPPAPVNAAGPDKPVRHRMQDSQPARAKQRANKKPQKRPPVAARSKMVPKARAQTQTQTLPKVVIQADPRPAPAPITDTESYLTKAGDYDFLIHHGGLPRTYRLHVPASYESTAPAPLLVALHGPGRHANLQEANDGTYGLVGKSEREGFIVVFPHASGKAGPGRTWNTAPAEAASGVDDVGFIGRVVLNVFRQVSIDRSRIYATGVSSGGAMAYRLACEMPEVFRAVAPVAAADGTAGCAPAKPVSVLHIHARDDSNAPFGGVADLAPSGKSRPADTTSVPQSVARWAQLDGCAATPRRILDKDGAYCEAYSWCRARSEVQLCVTDSGGHSWPGGRAPQGEPSPSVAISATEMMWDFFSRH